VSRTKRLPLGIAISVVVMAVAVAPPGIHFVTVPLAPLIAGYVVGSRLHYTPGDAAIFGIILGLITAGAVTFSFERLPLLPSLSVAAVGFFAAMAALYVGGLAGIAAGVSGRGDDRSASAG
jgi:hypothetical protein